MDSASKLVQLVQVRLKGAPEYLCSAAVRKAFSQICRQTDCWRRTVTFVADTGRMEATVDDKLLLDFPDLGYEADLVRLFRVLVQEYDADADSYGTATEKPEGSFRVRRGEKLQIEFDSTGAVEDDDQVTIDVAIAPYEMGTTLGDIPPGIVQLCGEAAVHLAAADLLRMPHRPWTDVEAGQWEYVEGMNAVRMILANADNGSTGATASAPVIGIVEG